MLDFSEQDYNTLIETLDRLIDKYNSYTKEDKLKMMLADRVELLTDKVGTKALIGQDIKKAAREQELMKNAGINYLDYETPITILAQLSLYIKKYSEDQRQVLRANYNLKTNNEMFRILNYIINRDLKYNDLINDNSNIFRINLSFFIINLLFEKINDRLKEIIFSSVDTVEDKISFLLEKYDNDAQMIGEILVTNFKLVKKDEALRSNYRIMKEFLQSKGFNSESSSLFIITRNAASHGDFYPNIIDKNTIDLIVFAKGEEQRRISLQSLLTFIDSKLSVFSLEEKYKVLLELFQSRNLIETINKMIEEGKKDELLKTLAILSMFNIVQYNNENHFKNIHDMKNKENRLIDSLKIKEFFSTTYSQDEKTNYDILQTIKNAIGHMNVIVNGDIITFYNKMKEEKCSCSITDLFNFLLVDDLYSMTSQTSYFQHLKSEEKRIKEAFSNYNNEIYRFEDLSDTVVYNKYPYDEDSEDINTNIINDNKFKK